MTLAARVVGHPELPPDQRRDAAQGPLLGLKAGRHQGCSTLWNAEEVEETIEAADGGAEAVLGE